MASLRCRVVGVYQLGLEDLVRTEALLALEDKVPGPLRPAGDTPQRPGWQLVMPADGTGATGRANSDCPEPQTWVFKNKLFFARLRVGTISQSLSKPVRVRLPKLQDSHQK
eukprot:EG_transcript_17877